MTDERHTRKEAVALSYEPFSAGAPKVVAKGKGKIAENILEKAKEIIYRFKKIPVSLKF